MLLAMVLGMSAVAAIVVADDEWAWRDSLRRMARGEVVPAYRANTWADAASVSEELADSLLTSDLSPSLDDWETRRDLALYTLVSAAGDSTISREGDAMGKLMEELCIDVDWLEEMVYFCPLEHAKTAMPILAHIYRMEKKRMEGMPAHRRLASAISFEFARAGLGQDAALEAYQFYVSGGQKHWLNHQFTKLAIWQMRVIAARYTDSVWSNKETLTWFQRNNRLPAQGYVHAGEKLGNHELSLFGQRVDTQGFRALYGDADEGGTASLYEASGCSTAHNRAFYAATAACANGVPALVAVAADDAVCLVDVNGKWETSAPLPEGASCSWGYLGQYHPDFVKLAAAHGQEIDKTLASARLAAMGQFHYESGNRPQAQEWYREAVKTQPLNYAAWLGYQAAGAGQDALQQAPSHFEQLPGVAAALRSQLAR